MTGKRTPASQSSELSQAATIGELEAAFTQLPPKQVGLSEMTTKEIVTKIKPALAGARKKHYSWEEIHDLFGQLTGREIALVTLKSYMQENRTPTDGQYGVARQSRRLVEPPQPAHQPMEHEPARKSPPKNAATSKKRLIRRKIA